MRLKLDENLGARCLSILAGAGHDVETVPSQGLCSASDEALHAVCRAEGRVLVTMDLDFANPLRFVPSAGAGTAVIRLPGRASAADLERAVQVLVRGLQALVEVGLRGLESGHACLERGGVGAGLVAFVPERGGVGLEQVELGAQGLEVGRGLVEEFGLGLVVLSQGVGPGAKSKFLADRQTEIS